MIKSVLDKINSSKVCVGNPDTKFDALVKLRQGFFKDQSGTHIALLYFAWARSKVKVCYYFHILWHRAVFAQLPENTAHLGKYSTLSKNSFS